MSFFVTKTSPENFEESHERSSLISPSAASTERPTLSNLNEYGTVRTDEQVPTHPGDQDATKHSMKSDSVASLEFLVSGVEDEEGPLKRRPHLAGRRLNRFYRAHRGLLIGLLLIALGIALLVARQVTKPAPILRDHTRDPFSSLDPIKDMGMYDFVRPQDSSPPKNLREAGFRALPTNAWYENWLLIKGEPSPLHRVYTIPYILDLVGPIPGLRMHPVHIDSTQNVVQLSTVDQHALTLGAARASATRHMIDAKPLTRQFSVESTTPLGITLEWDAFPMVSSIVRGMPYATMHFPGTLGDVDEHGVLKLPTIASEVELLDQPLVDGKHSSLCDTTELVPVERELQLTFADSDFTWLVFFSEPVYLWCTKDPEGYEPSKVIIQVTDAARIQETSGAPAHDIEDLTIRVALLTDCASGMNPIHCPGGQKPPSSVTRQYGDLLRKHAGIIPGPNSDVQFSFDEDSRNASVTLDWDAQDMTDRNTLDVLNRGLPRLQLRQATENVDDVTSQELIMFALPHHMDTMADVDEVKDAHICMPSLIGPACLVSGKKWSLDEQLPQTSFRAARPPRPEALSSLAEALQEDMNFRLPHYYRRGAGDTYFSGKMLAKAGRILMIADELSQLCSGEASYEEEISRSKIAQYREACRNLVLPSRRVLDDMLSALRDSVEIWINGEAEVPFIYDSAWGGVISCGCDFDGETKSCSNKFPHCPIASDPGLNFGNGFYNDHHFHYGYTISAAAVVAHFDPAWGREHFEQVLLLIRDIANPSADDVHFPVFRHKDWFQGNSWASGVALAYMNGRNQESSSEAIASYEGVSLFGQAMINAWAESKNMDKVNTAARIRDVGRLLTATEIRAADRYWHVRQEEDAKKIYPDTYKENVIGIMWNTMAQFQTWFGNAPYLPYGIQLLPLTPIAEDRDDSEWLREMYKPFADGCADQDGCIDQGWIVLQLAVLAAVGHVDLAMERSLELPNSVFESAGGDGHSLTNTLWYIATRPHAEPLELPESDPSSQGPKNPPSTGGGKVTLVDCGVPETCTDDILDADAGGYSCRARISYLINTFAMSQSRACSQVAGNEYPSACGACDPCAGGKDCAEKEPAKCPPCTEEVCHSEMNRCPWYETTFLCTEGSSIGGCSPYPWDLSPVTCSTCCELTDCQHNMYEDESIEDANDFIDDETCPPCSDDVCNSRLNLCPSHRAPFLCTHGISKGGCSPTPWNMADQQCTECCRLQPGCRHAL